MRNKIEKNTSYKTVFTWFGNLSTSMKLQKSHYFGSGRHPDQTQLGFTNPNTKCSAPLSIKADHVNLDRVVESGASRMSEKEERQVKICLDSL